YRSSYATLGLGIVLTWVLGLMSFGAFTAKPHTPGLETTTPDTATLPAFKHIFVIVLENESYDSVIGNAQAGYLNTLAQKYGRATYSYAISHPSLPNYLTLIGGDTFGITTDCTRCTVD